MTLIATITLFIMLAANATEATTTSSNAEKLAKMFSPILVLTEETSTEYDATEPIQEIKNVGGKPDSGRALRIARKLGTGALWGIVPTYVGGFFLTAIASGNTGGGTFDGLGRGVFMDFIVGFGYPVGVGVGVRRADLSSRFIYSLAGSAAGFMSLALIPRTEIYQFSAFRWDVIWNWFALPLVGAVIASELGRDHPDESRRFSINVAPSLGSLSAVAKLRF